MFIILLWLVLPIFISYWICNPTCTCQCHITTQLNLNWGILYPITVLYLISNFKIYIMLNIWLVNFWKLWFINTYLQNKHKTHMHCFSYVFSKHSQTVLVYSLLLYPLLTVVFVPTSLIYLLLLFLHLPHIRSRPHLFYFSIHPNYSHPLHIHLQPLYYFNLFQSSSFVIFYFFFL